MLSAERQMEQNNYVFKAFTVDFSNMQISYFSIRQWHAW